MAAYHVFLFLLSSYILLLLFSGVYFSKKQHTGTDFWLAGKRAGSLSIGFSAAASWLTAGALLAVTGFFMLQGVGSIWGFVAPNIIALVIIGLFVGRIKRLPSITQPELLELRYGNGLRLPVAIIISVVMILFAVADIKGFALVLQIFYGVDMVHSALIVGLAVAVYVGLGGLSAVLATDVMQFIFLSLFIIIMAFLVMRGASDVSGVSVVELVSKSPTQWWNPLSLGMPMVLIFLAAIVPGWITEQDPWQKVWAAKDGRSARRGMFLGAALVTIVFLGCIFIALGLNSLYPEIAKMGFPMGMSAAEPALLTFIMDSGFSNGVVAVCGVALATAAMSCADTFATSGASCIARDIYQRYLNPSATMREMRVANRLSVLLIIGFATLGSFFIDSIIEAIHIATFIASASYFFPLIGGIFWKKASSEGALYSMYIGFLLQVIFVVVDKIYTLPMAPPFLETIHPLFMGHGVLFSMIASGLVFISVSLASKPVKKSHLIPFFPELLTGNSSEIEATTIPDENGGELEGAVESCLGTNTRVQLTLSMGGNVNWIDFTSYLSKVSNWSVNSGPGMLQRFSADLPDSAILLTRGDSRKDLWLEAECSSENIEKLKQILLLVKDEVRKAALASQESVDNTQRLHPGMKPA